MIGHYITSDTIILTLCSIFSPTTQSDLTYSFIYDPWIIRAILQMRKLRYREIEQIVPLMFKWYLLEEQRDYFMKVYLLFLNEF